MAITFEVLGAPGRDNALFVRIDSGQSIARLLFDCGEGCVSTLSFSEIQAIDYLLFSHLHMDHVGGFDSFFRCNFDRDTRPNVIYGPPQTSNILQHRFQGYIWNLTEGSHATWQVCDVLPDRVERRRYELAEAFSIAHQEGSFPREGVLIDGPDYTVECVTMDHLTPSLAYIVCERPRQNIDVSRLASLGLKGGPWLRQLKEASAELPFVEINGVRHDAAELRKALLVETPGESIAYLTDFLMDEAALARLETTVRGCKTVICESQYCQADLDLAQRNYHMTSQLAAEAARRADVGELVLFHISDRYTRDDWREMLREAQAIFPKTRFPEAWEI